MTAHEDYPLLALYAARSRNGGTRVEATRALDEIRLLRGDVTNGLAERCQLHDVLAHIVEAGEYKPACELCRRAEALVSPREDRTPPVEVVKPAGFIPMSHATYEEFSGQLIASREEHPPAPPAMQPAPIDCPNCGGEGQVDGLVLDGDVMSERCARCGGRGVITKETPTDAG